MASGSRLQPGSREFDSPHSLQRFVAQPGRAHIAQGGAGAAKHMDVREQPADNREVSSSNLLEATNFIAPMAQLDRAPGLPRVIFLGAPICLGSQTGKGIGFLLRQLRVQILPGAPILRVRGVTSNTRGFEPRIGGAEPPRPSRFRRHPRARASLSPRSDL
jgi:hypothetical protein